MIIRPATKYSIALIAMIASASVPFGLAPLVAAPLFPGQPPFDPPIRPRPPRLPIQPILPRPLPDNIVSVKLVQVEATIRDTVAETEVTHVLVNRTGVPQEADFLFPIPANAEVSSFALYDGDRRMDARLLDKDEATSAYEEIVRRRRDPALLSFQGRAALRARVFPIPAGSERKITLKLVSVLPREGDARKYSWTLVGPHLPGAVRPEQVSVHITVQGQNIGSLYSPTHPLDIKRQDTGATATWNSSGSEEQLAENPELSLFIGSKSSKPVALSVLTYNAALPQVASLSGGVRQSGYFMVVASPTITASEQTVPPRRVVLIMDRSGSMQGKKIEQAKGALRFALGKLRPQDRFNIITFSDSVEKFAPETIAATPENRQRAEAFVDGIIADGGTNINEALLTGLKQFPERGSGNTLLFFTDGLPTVGVRSQDLILQNAIRENEKRTRTFVFGVGYDVDVPFLDTVAKSLRGDADYVRPDEDIEVKTSQFVAKTSAPVLENIRFSLTGARTGEVYPQSGDMPDLFSGGQLILVGRYMGGADAVTITLTGEENGKPQSYSLPAKFPAVETGADFLPRLWASRKIGYLMDEVRLKAEGDARKEVIDQIISLSKEYGILTPYTSLFVPEPGEPGTPRFMPVDSPRTSGTGNAAGGRGGFGGGGAPLDLSAAAPTAQLKAMRQGEAAVNYSQASRAQRNQAIIGNSGVVTAQAGADKERSKDLARRIQNVNARTFYQSGTNGLWQDASYDTKKQSEIVKIKLYSPAYFALLRRNRDYAKWAAVGENVLIVANAKQAIQFGSEGKESLTDSELKALTGK